MMVDSIPTVQVAPSKIRLTSGPKSLSTSAALVGDSCPNLFADGPTIPPPNSLSKAIAMGCAGNLMATVS